MMVLLNHEERCCLEIFDSVCASKLSMKYAYLLLTKAEQNLKDGEIPMGVFI